MTSSERRAEINMSDIPVNGIGGLGLVAGAVLMTAVFPEAWWLLVGGVSGGAMIAAVIVLVRRHHVSPGPSGDDPTILFRPEAVARSRQDQTTVRSRPDTDASGQ